MFLIKSITSNEARVTDKSGLVSFFEKLNTSTEVAKRLLIRANREKEFTYKGFLVTKNTKKEIAIQDPLIDLSTPVEIRAVKVKTKAKKALGYKIFDQLTKKRIEVSAGLLAQHFRDINLPGLEKNIQNAFAKDKLLETVEVLERYLVTELIEDSRYFKEMKKFTGRRSFIPKIFKMKTVYEFSEKPKAEVKEITIKSEKSKSTTKTRDTLEDRMKRHSPGFSLGAVIN